jgi:hypothetical protein
MGTGPESILLLLIVFQVGLDHDGEDRIAKLEQGPEGLWLL